MERRIKEEAEGVRKPKASIETANSADTPDPNAYSWYNPVGWLAGSSSVEVQEEEPAQTHEEEPAQTQEETVEPQSPSVEVSEARNTPTETE